MARLRTQFGALPFRFGEDGQFRILLITSRETRRWVIPKGWPIKGKAPHQTAAREAFEEAGLKGEISRNPVGSYLYGKRLRDGAVVDCCVDVFAFRVLEQRRRWPEYEQRVTSWFLPEEAAGLVHEADLSALLLGFADALTTAA